MRLTSISITNLAAFGGAVTFPLSAVTLIQGDHGVGKSSLQLIMAYAFGRRPLAEAGARGVEHDPSIIHGKEEKGEAVITFDDGSAFRVLVTGDKTTRTIKAPGEKKSTVATPAFIDSLVNALSYDPFTFKDLAEKQRVEALLKASPVTVTAAEMDEAVGHHVDDPPSLESINAIYSYIFEQRTGTRREADTLIKHAAELAKALPAEAPGTDWQTERARLTAEKEKHERAETELIAKVGKVLNETLIEYQAAERSQLAEIDSDINAKIAALEVERVGRREKATKLLTDSTAAARVEANSAVASKRELWAPARDKIISDLATVEANALSAAGAEGTRKAEAAARAQANAAAAKVSEMTAALERLAALKESVAGRLAVPGVTIAAAKPGLPVDICREEKGALIPFSRWNDADKERFCLRMAVLFHGKCGVVFVDEIGHFTDERKAALIETAKKYAKDAGMQWIFGEATGGELKVVAA